VLVVLSLLGQVLGLPSAFQGLIQWQLKSMGILLRTITRTIDEQKNEKGNGFPFQSVNLNHSFGAVPLRKPKIVFKDCRHKTQLFLNIFG